MTALLDQLRALPSETIELLKRHGFAEERFFKLAERIGNESSDSNLVQGSVEAPHDEDIFSFPPKGSAEEAKLIALGEAALRNGECALLVMAGGMATRMGGVVKALVDALPGKTFLDLRLAEVEASNRKFGKTMPFWMMTSDATDDAIRQALGDKLSDYELTTFRQELSLRLDPEGNVFKTDDGGVSAHAPGHGDLVDALKRSGLLTRFIANGGKYITVANIDNLGAGVDPLVLGAHIASGKSASCEVVDKVGTDKGGIPLRHNGRPVILEEFRIPPHFDPAEVRVFNTNTFHFNASALNDIDIDWTFFLVNKKVEGRSAIQFERLLGEVTSHMDTVYLRVPREGAESRFLPVKDFDELATRAADIEAVAKLRGSIV